LKDFDAMKHISFYPAHSILFLEQQRCKGVYLLCEGQVKLSFGSRDGKTLILGIANSGELLGLSSALSGNPHESTAEALLPCQVAFCSTADFQQFLWMHPGVFERVAINLGRQYKTACQQLRGLAFGASVSERVASFLLKWSFERGASRSATRFTLPLRHQELADHLGVSRETVTRALSELRSRGLIERYGTTFVIADRSALQQFRIRPAQPESAKPFSVDSASCAMIGSERAKESISQSGRD
jgi:CRP/FNR family transcriptional regulator